MTWALRLLAFGLCVSIALVTYRVWRRQKSREHWIRRAVFVSSILLAVLVLHEAWHAVQSERVTARQRASARVLGAHAFQDRGCSNCHSVGGGVVVGPDLGTVSSKYDHATLVQWIESPESIYRARRKQPLNDGFPEMPNLGVEPLEAEAIAEYLAGDAPARR